VSGVPRSQALIEWLSTAAGEAPRFVCPAGYVTLVKSAYWSSAAAATVNSSLFVMTATNVQVILATAQLQQNGMSEWQGWLAMNPGDAVHVFSDAADVRVIVSGAVLTGAPQFPILFGTHLPTVEPNR